MSRPTHHKSGFTLIELLTVIAIIAILAALIFPVFGRAREQARQTNCMTNLRELYTALKLYHEDNSKYPATLLGFVQSDVLAADNKPSFYVGPGSGNPLPIERLTYRPLKTGQNYIKDKINYICPDSPNNNASLITPVVYPDQLNPKPDAESPLSGQQVVFTRLIKDNCCDAKVEAVIGQPIHYYRYDSYDIGPKLGANGRAVKNGGNDVYELHYSLDWSGEAATGKTDYPNQLKYPDPPQDTTVVTWCTYHSAVAGTDNIPVLMLSGRVAAVPRSRFYENGVLAFK
ncbi:MAG: prepilin-type N-terminal cleavage/methylation domain-containing protein [Chthonomonadaceae bacterium]|nr:prepilin-type N-terminal cleavage/methylation domain-containing protein [Chthonomonadaceae bacterium]